MATYNKKEFQEYLMTKVAESTAKIYATDMAVCVKALEKIKLYEDKELEEILEDFISHKKAVKNYLQDEFLTALTEIGSNDSGLYDGIASKAKHYIAMKNNSNVESTQETANKTSPKLTDEEKKWAEEWADEDAPENVRYSKNFMIEAIKKDEGWLKCTSDELKNDREIVMLAVQKYALALKYASDELKNDREIVMLAVQNDDSALEYASDELKNDREIVLNLLKALNEENILNLNESYYRLKLPPSDMSPNIFLHEEIVSEICKHTPYEFINSILYRHDSGELIVENLKNFNTIISNSIQQKIENDIEKVEKIFNDNSLSYQKKCSEIQYILRLYYNHELGRFNSSYELVRFKSSDDFWDKDTRSDDYELFTKIENWIKDGIFAQLREQASSFEDYRDLINMVVPILRVPDVLTDYELTDELYKEASSYIDDADVNALLSALQDEEYYCLSDRVPEVFEEMIEKIGDILISFSVYEIIDHMGDYEGKIGYLSDETKSDLLEKLESELSEEDLDEYGYLLDELRY